MATQRKKDNQPTKDSPATAEAESAGVPLISDQNPAQNEGGPISWTASEFIAHQKSAGWYGFLVLGTIVVVAVVYLLTKDKISSIAVLVAGVAFGFYAARQPRQLEYRLDTGGVSIGGKFHSYSSFRSFAIVPEGAFSSIILMPLDRFALLTTIYYDPHDEDKIVKLLGNVLPLQEYRHDLVDQLLRRIRF